MTYLRVPPEKWEKFQAFKDGRPIKWIALWLSLLDDYDFMCLSDISRSHVILLWLLAARTNQRIPNDKDWLKRTMHTNRPPNVAEFISLGFIERYEEGEGGVRNSTEPYESVPIRQDKTVQDKTREEKGDSAPHPAGRDAEVLLVFPIKRKPHEPNGSTEWELTRGKLREYHEVFGESMDVMAEARKALQWVRDDMSRKKTAGGMPKFLGGWFGRANNRGKAVPPKGSRARTDTKPKRTADNVFMDTCHIIRDAFNGVGIEPGDSGAFGDGAIGKAVRIENITCLLHDAGFDKDAVRAVLARVAKVQPKDGG